MHLTRGWRKGGRKRALQSMDYIIKEGPLAPLHRTNRPTDQHYLSSLIRLCAVASADQKSLNASSVAHNTVQVQCSAVLLLPRVKSVSSKNELLKIDTSDCAIRLNSPLLLLCPSLSLCLYSSSWCSHPDCCCCCYCPPIGLMIVLFSDE